jgi:regulation of enolase protein 1 (concanavalin A-like superfamily)
LLRRQGTPDAAHAISRLYPTVSGPDRLSALSALENIGVPEAMLVIGKETVARDEFSHEDTLDWQILKPDPSHTVLDRDAGTLNITAQDGDFYEARDDCRNVYLIPNPVKGRDFQITTCLVGFRPTVPWQQAALLCWNDADNYIKFSYGAGAPDQQRLAFITERNGATINSKFSVPAGPGKLWLRLTKIGNRFSCSTSQDGAEFTSHGFQVWDGGDSGFFGLAAMSPGKTNSEEIDASFDFFEVVALPPSGTKSAPTEPLPEK